MSGVPSPPTKNSLIYFLSLKGKEKIVEKEFREEGKNNHEPRHSEAPDHLTLIYNSEEWSSLILERRRKEEKRR